MIQLNSLRFSRKTDLLFHPIKRQFHSQLMKSICNSLVLTSLLHEARSRPLILGVPQSPLQSTSALAWQTCSLNPKQNMFPAFPGVSAQVIPLDSNIFVFPQASLVPMHPPNLVPDSLSLLLPTTQQHQQLCVHSPMELSDVTVQLSSVGSGCSTFCCLRARTTPLFSTPPPVQWEGPHMDCSEQVQGTDRGPGPSYRLVPTL